MRFHKVAAARLRSPSVFFAAVLACSSGAAFAQSRASSPAPCGSVSFETVPYTVCELPLRRFEARLYWQKPDGAPYNYLKALPKTLKADEPLVAAFNGGMFHPDYKPVGLYIENGHERVKANTHAGPGNFHLKPNGVFYVGDGVAGVMETSAFLKARPKAVFATQSGPMLVINGKMHPQLTTSNISAKSRDGVCVRDGNVIVFAISEKDVPFEGFIRLFRDRLKCRDALFLDGGTAPALYLPSAGRAGNSFVPLGPMIGFYEKAK